MKSGKKCPRCESCLDIVWIEPRRFFHCWLCKAFYDDPNGELKLINITEVINLTQEQVEEILAGYYNE